MASGPMSPLCVPDAYLTEDRLRVLLTEFNACLAHGVPRQSIFANLVNSVRQLYVSQILILQQDLVSRSTPDVSDSITTQYDRQLTVQHDQLTKQLEQEVAELTERHNRQLREINREREQEHAIWGKCIPSSWIVGIDIVYGDQEAQKPPNRIRELTIEAGDCINYGFSGKFVWLVPRYDTDPTNALTGVDISIQECSDDYKHSLAKGATGKYRYLLPQFVKDANKIHTMNLLRLDHKIEGAPVGFDGSTGNINNGRGGAWLYLIWKSQSV